MGRCLGPSGYGRSAEERAYHTLRASRSQDGRRTRNEMLARVAAVYTTAYAKTAQEGFMDAADTNKGDILVVDDNPVNLDLLSNMLLDRAYRVRVATNGRRALAAARSRAPDLVMLDINMPEMDGYEVCRQLKGDAATSDIPVIFISALDEAMDKVRAFEVGGADYVTKPFQFEEVLARIENQLKLSRLQRDLERKNGELTRKNEELVRWREALLHTQRRADNIFSALADVLPGTVLDEKYRLEDKIGSGGFGAVYSATHLALDRKVAVKIFR